MIKKIVYTFIACATVIVLVFGFTKVSSGKLEVDINHIFGEKIELVNEDFKVNSLQREKSYYYYNRLSENEKYVYSALIRAIANLEKKVILDLSEINSEEFTKVVSKAINSLFADHPEVFYLKRTYSAGIQKSLLDEKYYLELDYKVKDKIELDEKIADMEMAINKIVSKANKSDIFVNESIIHDEIIKTIKYDYTKDEDADTHNSYSALVGKKAVCDGITKALQLVLDRLDIESLLVTGQVKEGNHAWCLVNIEDEWFNLDATSNMAINNGEITMHAFFNIDSESMRKTHVFDNLDELPIANVKDKTYYDLFGLHFKNNSTFDQDFKNVLVKFRNRNYIEFKTKDVLSVDSRFNKILSADEVFMKNLKDDKIIFYKVADTYIIKNK